MLYEVITTVYYHYPEVTLAACYRLEAVDETGNQSDCSDNIQCIDICSYYELPNIFTPNSDNVNDLYHPYPYKFVESIDMKIYNRWGDLVFETTDPDINWDGKDIKTNKLVSEGVYYYICDVYEERLTGRITSYNVCYTKLLRFRVFYMLFPEIMVT